MWVLLVCSLLAVVVFFERMFHLHRAQIRSNDFLKGIYNILLRRNIAEAVSICEETPGPEAHIVRAAILHHDEDKQSIRQAIEEAGLAEVPRLERHLNVLATIAQITPLIGLLGTVLGMMHALMAIEQHAPLVHPGVLASGVWQALISTAAGLSVAIPTYAAYNFLMSRIESILLDMERTSSEIFTVLTSRDGHNRMNIYEPDGTTHS